MTNSTPTVFLHLTKTAGGTLKRALSGTDNYSVEMLYGPSDVERISQLNLDTTDMIYGHSVFGIHEKLGLNAIPRYMCFMRHPVTRTISHYHHLRNVDKGPVGDKIRASKDINDFFENSNHWEFSNFMVKIISGVGSKKPDQGVDAYQLAVENIEQHFDFIGFQEYFPLSLKKLSTTIERTIETEKDINVGRYRLEEVSDQTLEKIFNINKNDIRLYKFALRKFL